MKKPWYMERVETGLSQDEAAEQTRKWIKKSGFRVLDDRLDAEGKRHITFKLRRSS